MAATQSQTSFPAAFSKESDSEGEEGKDGRRENKRRGIAAQTRLSQSVAVTNTRQRSSFGDWRARTGSNGGRQSPNQNLSLRTVKERIPSIEEDKDDNSMAQSQLLTRPTDQRQLATSSATSFGQELGTVAQSEDVANQPTQDDKGASRTETQTDPSSVPTAKRTLPGIIAGIFGFAEHEEVVAEYPCWYLQNVLLQGYMYVTRKHVCFYAYLQKRANVIEKTGHIGKQGRHSYNYRQYYFILKGDTLSYYRDATDPYFPLGMVDLRFAISAEVTMESGQSTTDFTITTGDRVYLYRAESVASAKSWVKIIQKIIFRTHNEGDSVKIALPLENIDEVERMPMIDFAETVKLRVLDKDETFAVDEYFFTFFGEAGPQALEVISGLTRQIQTETGSDGEVSMTTTQILPPTRRTIRSAEDRDQILSSDDSPSGIKRRTQPTTLAQPGLRGSQEPTATGRAPLQSPQESIDSLATSTEQGEQSSDNDEDMHASMSASQMLTGDGVFGSPTLRSPHGARTNLDEHANPRNAEYNNPSLGPTASPRLDNLSDQETLRRPNMDGTALSRGKQAALSVANVVRSSSKRMSSYLGSSPQLYIGKLTEAVIGGTRHYNDTHIPAPDENSRGSEASADILTRQQRFQEHFALPQTENLEATYFCYLHKNLPQYGKIYISKRRFCFRSLIYGVRTKLVIPLREIANVETQRGFRLGYSGIVLVIHGHEELFFEFRTETARNDCAGTILRKIDASQLSESIALLTDEQRVDAEGAAAENKLLKAARKGIAVEDVDDFYGSDEEDDAPILSDDPTASLVDLAPPPSMLVTCLTIGSRGDVQPYIALCKGLMAQGHRARIATHAEFRGWVEGHGIEFAEVAGDPAELMRVCVENGMFTIPFFMEANSKFRSWLDGLLVTAWEACQGSDLIIESPSAMCGIHIAEALQVPYFRAFTMPWTRTRAYPHAFAVRNAKMGGAYNYMTYTLFDNVFWTWTEGQINSWRAKTLHLRPTNLDKLQQNKVPFLYNFSPSVVPPPLDFSDWVKVTGYWFLNEGADYQPPADLEAFIKKARADNMKIVYIGFGSVTVNDSRKLTEQIVSAVVKADVRCILSKGWSDRFDDKTSNLPELVLPPCIHSIRSAPHDWLFSQIDAVVHHGGAGTTGASLRAGKPTIIKPFFGDQYFFATRVEDLGVGIYLTKATEQQLGKALWTAVHDDRMQMKARLLGEAIRAQDGVHTAIQAIYADLEYARSLIKQKSARVNSSHQASSSATVAKKDVESVDGDTLLAILHEDTEENWTFIEAGNGNEANVETDRSSTSSPIIITESDVSARPQQPRGSLATTLRLGPTFLGRKA